MVFRTGDKFCFRAPDGRVLVGCVTWTNPEAGHLRVVVIPGPGEASGSYRITESDILEEV
jgi:hypothetical protein